MQAATSSHPAPRRHAVKLRHSFVSPAIAVPSAPTFTLHELSRVLPAACAVGDNTAHGFGGYVGAPLVVLHFVARRRLPAVKRTATVPGRVGLQGQDRATCCIAHPFGGYAANTPPRPTSFLLHYAGGTRPRQTRCAGLPVKSKHDQRFARVGIKQPGCSLRSTARRRAGVNRCAIEHNRALPKVGQSLRRLRLAAYRSRALRVRVMVGYVLRPSPDKGYVGVAIAAFGYSGAARI